MDVIGAIGGTGAAPRTAAPLLSHRRPDGPLRHLARHRARGREPDLFRLAGRDRRHRRRERFRQIRLGAGHHAAAAAQHGARDEWHDHLRRPQSADAHRRGDAPDPRPRRRDDLSGADDVAQSGAVDRPADQGAAAHPHGHERGAGNGACDRTADAGWHHRSGEPPRAVSAPAVGRHAPARDDRHRPRLQSETADRGRADDRARRDHPGADPGTDEGPGAPAQHRRHRHHAQPRHRRALRRPRERHVRGPPRRKRSGRSRVRSRPAHPYARGLLSAVPRLDRARTARLATIDGAPPNLLNPPDGCRFAPRCRYAAEICKVVPKPTRVEAGHTRRLPPPRRGRSA